MRRKLSALTLCLSFLMLPAFAQSTAIPLGSHNEIYTVPVQINGSITLQFFVDTGASVVAIPESVLQYLVNNGTVTQRDVGGLAAAVLADRSRYRAIGVRLRELRVGDEVVRDVEATVVPGIAYPLLGQSFLRRFGSVTFDNERHLLVLSRPSAVAQAEPRWSGAPAYPASGATLPSNARGYGPAAYGWGSPYGTDYQPSIPAFPPAYGGYPTR